jgi:integrase
MLRRQKVQQNRLKLAAGPAWSTEWTGLVFLTASGVPPNASNIRRELRATLVRAGVDIDQFTPYELRHTCATLLYESGLDVPAIVRQLGQADDRMFYRHYLHRTDPIHRAAEGVLDRLATQA